MDANTSQVLHWQFFRKNPSLIYQDVLQALNQGHAILVSRKLFATEEETLEYLPPKKPLDIHWADKIRPWHTQRRHVYIACFIPGTHTLITSSAEPDKTIFPWPLRFCQSQDPLAKQDTHIIEDNCAWGKYHANAVILSKTNYPTQAIVNTIEWFRENPPRIKYSVDNTHGYDCQAASRDVLQIVNPSINAKNHPLPEGTTLLAYQSDSSVLNDDNIQTDQKIAI